MGRAPGSPAEPTGFGRNGYTTKPMSGLPSLSVFSRRCVRIIRASRDFSLFQMGKIMPQESRSFIEAECLRVARLQPACEHLKAVAIARLAQPNVSPNWEVLAFWPELPSAVRAKAIEATENMRRQYVLAPFINSRKGREQQKLCLEPGQRAAAKLLTRDEAADRGRQRQTAGAAKSQR
jgi:hypothetical protein